MNDRELGAEGEQEVLELLRQTLDRLPLQRIPADDAPPPDLIEGSLFVHDWHNMDAELAEIEFDSAVDRELAGVRSSGGTLRELTFVAAGRRVELEIEPGPDSANISGRIEPPGVGTFQLVVGGEVFRGDVEPDGSFVIEEVSHGTALAFIDADEGRIRLGAFGI